MNIVKSLIATGVLAAVSLVAPAHATVIDFNGLVGTNVPGNSGNYGTFNAFAPGAIFTMSGFKFVGTGYNYLIGSAYSNSNDHSSLAYNGTDYFMGNGAVTISSATGSQFTVNSLNLAKWSDGGGSNQVTFVGNKVGGGSITQIIGMNTPSNSANFTGNDFGVYALNGFGNLSSLRITHSFSDYLAIDNLIVNATSVPEPSSLALFGLAVAAGAFARRRAGKSS